MEIPRLSTWPVIGRVARAAVIFRTHDSDPNGTKRYIWIPTNLPYKITQNVGTYTVRPMDPVGVA